MAMTTQMFEWPWGDGASQKRSRYVSVVARGGVHIAERFTTRRDLRATSDDPPPLAQWWVAEWKKNSARNF